MRSFSWIGRLVVPGVLLLGLWLVSPVKANEVGKDQGASSVKVDGDPSSDSEQYVAAGRQTQLAHRGGGIGIDLVRRGAAKDALPPAPEPCRQD